MTFLAWIYTFAMLCWHHFGMSVCWHGSYVSVGWHKLKHRKNGLLFFAKKPSIWKTPSYLHESKFVLQSSFTISGPACQCATCLVLFLSNTPIVVCHCALAYPNLCSPHIQFFPCTLPQSIQPFEFFAYKFLNPSSHQNRLVPPPTPRPSKT